MDCLYAVVKVGGRGNGLQSFDDNTSNRKKCALNALLKVTPIVNRGNFMHSAICNGLGSLECFVIIKCTKFGQLILRKIIKIVASRCQILRLKCTKLDFGWGSAPEGQTSLGSLQRSPRPPSWI